MRQNENYPTIRGAAAMGPLSEHTLRQMLRRGELPGFYVGSHYRVNYEMLLEMLQDASARCGREADG